MANSQMDVYTLMMLFGGLALIGVGIVIILNSKGRGFQQVQIDAKQTSEKGPTEVKKEEAKVKKDIQRKVPLEEINLPEGFPQEVAFYFGS